MPISSWNSLLASHDMQNKIQIPYYGLKGPPEFSSFCLFNLTSPLSHSFSSSHTGFLIIPWTLQMVSVSKALHLLLLLPGMLLLQIPAQSDITSFRSLLSGPLLALSQRVPLPPFSGHFLSLCPLVFFGFLLFQSIHHGLTLYCISPLVSSMLWRILAVSSLCAQ